MTKKPCVNKIYSWSRGFVKFVPCLLLYFSNKGALLILPCIQGVYLTFKRGMFRVGGSCNFPILCAHFLGSNKSQGLLAGRELYRALPVMTRAVIYTILSECCQVKSFLKLWFLATSFSYYFKIIFKNEFCRKTNFSFKCGW